MKAQKQKNNFAQKYMNNVKALFPLIRKQERIYLRQMRQNIDDYCEISTVSSLEELYEEFGSPQDVVYNYYSIMDASQLFTMIRFHQIIKCVSIFIALIIVCAMLFREHLIMMRQEAIFTETAITNTEEGLR